MSTSLHFEGPSDLSVGDIRISGSEGVAKEWIATPGDRTLSEPMTPGYYIAEIAPAGVRPQSVVFQVHRGMANTVTLPDFAALAATGDATNFLNVDDPAKAMNELAGRAQEAEPDAGRLSSNLVAATDAPPSGTPPPPSIEPPAPATEPPREIVLPTDIRLITAAIAMERAGEREGWDRFDGTSSAQLSAGRVSLLVTAPFDWTPRTGRRARLSVAIQDVRVERLLLPLYAGGTTVNIDPSSLAPNDVTLDVIPVDPNLRAIWRVLEAGTSEHAAAVRDNVLAVKAGEPAAAPDAVDPWGAMLAGLLFARFPDVFGPIGAGWANDLCRRHPWAADVFIIHARQIAGDARGSLDTFLDSAKRAIDLLVKAQTRGSPYFTFSNQLFNELVDSLTDIDGLPNDYAARLKRARLRWQRELPLQRGTGVSFSWLSRDPAKLRLEHILAPKRDVSGKLTGRHSTIALKGSIQGGAIAIETSTSGAPKQISGGSRPTERQVDRSSSTGERGPPDCPAVHRRRGPRDDPNKGRFGGRAIAKGFILAASFPDAARDEKRRYATISVVVEAGDSVDLALGDAAWFRLHPTFNPEWVKVFFRGWRATVTLKAWGGFTIGVWLPSQRIELELDLSQVEGAPRIVREL